MKQMKDRIWIALAALLMGGIIWALFSAKEKHFDWAETYYTNDDEPFCNSVLLELAETYFPENELTVVKRNIYHVLDSMQSNEHKNYFFAGNTFYMDDTTLQAFLSFIEKGNDAFIAARSFPDEVAGKLFMAAGYISQDTSSEVNYYNTGQNYTYGDIADEDNFTVLNNIIIKTAAQNINVNFLNPDLASINGYAYTYSEMDVPLAYNWKYFTSEFILKEEKSFEIQPLGKTGTGGYNFIELQYGQGKIYFFTTPLLLTNLYLIQKENLEYTSKLLSYLQPGNIIWDEYSKNRHSQYFRPPAEKGPLQFILSQTSLRWAWYLLLAGLFLFIVFKGKRLQQVIPVTEPNINKSLEFVQTIGRMHYLSKDAGNLVKQKMKLFLFHVKEKYRIQVHEINDAFYEKLSMHAQLPVADIKHIFATYSYLENQNTVSDEDAMDFHNILDQFYKKCK